MVNTKAGTVLLIYNKVYAKLADLAYKEHFELYVPRLLVT